MDPHLEEHQSDNLQLHMAEYEDIVREQKLMLRREQVNHHRQMKARHGEELRQMKEQLPPPEQRSEQEIHQAEQLRSVHKRQLEELKVTCRQQQRSQDEQFSQHFSKWRKAVHAASAVSDSAASAPPTVSSSLSVNRLHSNAIAAAATGGGGAMHVARAAARSMLPAASTETQFNPYSGVTDSHMARIEVGGRQSNGGGGGGGGASLATRHSFTQPPPPTARGINDSGGGRRARGGRAGQGRRPRSDRVVDTALSSSPWAPTTRVMTTAPSTSGSASVAMLEAVAEGEADGPAVVATGANQQPLRQWHHDVGGYGEGFQRNGWDRGQTAAGFGGGHGELRDDFQVNFVRVHGWMCREAGNAGKLEFFL